MSGQIRYGDYLKTRCLGHTLDFTRFAFKTYNNSKFIVGKHHRIICEALDEVIIGKTNRLIINLAPRFGKTEIAVKNFIAYGLCLNPAAKFLHLSYSNDLAIDNSRQIREMLTDETIHTLFGINITSKNNQKWYTDKAGGLYATSTGGQVTGFGAGKVDAEGEQDEEQAFDEFIPYYDSKFAGAIIIDDPIKPEDALSDNLREKVNLRFESTIRNRVNSRNTPIIIIMQRLHENDLCGYLMGVEPDKWKVVSLPAIQRDENGKEESLWPHKWTLEELKGFQETNSFVFETQYMQNPTPLEGLMYHAFKTYDILPPIAKGVRANYTDTADTGADFLCSICANVYRTGIYVTDILYTKKPMEYTEQATAQMLCKQETQVCMIESNNGGRAFSRNVERLTREYGNRRTSFWPYTQTKNKKVRIFTRSAEVNNMVIFPADWQTRWPEFAQDVKGYRKEGGNAHDDHADVLTALVEHIDDFLASQVSDEQLLRDFL